MSRPLVLSSLSLEYVRVRVSASASGAAVDPTADVVQMAFKQSGAEPSGGDWQAASWDTDDSTTPPTYFAQCLVGPAGTIVLADGEYEIFVKVIDTPESPVKKCGRLVLT